MDLKIQTEYSNLLSSFLPLQLLGRNKFQTGTAEREREQNKNITESCGRTTKSRSRKKGDIFCTGKLEFSTGLRDYFVLLSWIKFRYSLSMTNICFTMGLGKFCFTKFKMLITTYHTAVVWRSQVMRNAAVYPVSQTTCNSSS